MHHRDPTMAAFADIFHHRLLTLFYRAWADAQATVSLDREQEDFSRFLGSLIHIGFDSLNHRDSIHDHAKLHFSGHFIRQCRNPEGLVSVIRSFFGIPAQLQEFMVHWIEIEPEQQTRLGGEHQLGQTTLLGRAVRDAHSKFRLVLGPLDEAQYRSFLPGSPQSQALLDWVRQYIGVELSWDAVLCLKHEEVKGIRLGQPTPLGLSSWLGQRSAEQGHAQDVVIDYEFRHGLALKKQAAMAAKAPQSQETLDSADFSQLLIA